MSTPTKHLDTRSYAGFKTSIGDMLRSYRRLARLSAVVLCALGTASHGSAATFTWDGGGSDSNFTTAANWNPDEAPTASTGNTFVFTGSTGLTPTLNGTTDWQTTGITFGVSATDSFTIGPVSGGATAGSRFALQASAIIAQNSASNQTINATILLGGNTYSISGIGVGSLTLSSFRIGSAANPQLNINRDVTLGSFTVAGTTSVAPVLNVATGVTARVSGLIANPGGSGVASLVKNGEGILKLEATNGYSGTTTVNTGTLLINGNQSGATGVVTVNATASIGGTGTVGGAMTLSSGSFLAPGDGGVGALSATTVTWNPGAQLVFDLGAAGASIASPGTSDFLSLSGSLVKGGGVGGFTFDFLNSGEAGVYRLITAIDGLGTFAASDFTASNLATGLTGSFSIDSGSLYLTVVPEPAAWALLSVGLLALSFWRRTARLLR